MMIGRPISVEKQRYQFAVVKEWHPRCSARRKIQTCTTADTDVLEKVTEFSGQFTYE